MPRELLLRDPTRKSGLPIECHEHPADVEHDRLDLDDQECAAGRVERQDVDRAAFAECVERDFGRHDPALAAEPHQERLHERRVPAIPEAVEGFTLVLDPERECTTEGRDDGQHLMDRHSRDTPHLE